MSAEGRLQLVCDQRKPFPPLFGRKKRYLKFASSLKPRSMDVALENLPFFFLFFLFFFFSSAMGTASFCLHFGGQLHYPLCVPERCDFSPVRRIGVTSTAAPPAGPFVQAAERCLPLTIISLKEAGRSLLSASNERI